MSQNKLSDLPKTFGLNCTPKLYFPHKYNSEKNYGKLLPSLPPINDYYPENLKNEEYEKFKRWYEENRDSTFLLEEQLKIYCGQDTEILLKAVLAMRKIFIEITKDELSPNSYDVFKDITTIAGAAIKIYRAKFLKEKHLSIVPEEGYEKKYNQSMIAIKYFEWYMHKNNIKGRHAGFNVDFICGKLKIIIEFQGCAFHGCKKCFKPFQMGPNGKTADENYMKTKNRMYKLKKICKKYGLKVEEVWECSVKSKLNPRDKVNYFTPYPVKAPKIIVSKQHDVFWETPEDIPYDGLLKVRAIPPKNLNIPLLPYHADSILFFTNYGKCCKQAKPDFVFLKNVKKCRHTDTERGLHGVFTTIELKFAMELGYKIDKFYRAYHFEEFDSNLFKGYVRKFLKLKVESSGWPSNVTSDEQRINFINEYKRIFGIVINPKNMAYNSGMRYISKLLLNSLWGKFGMRNKLSKNKIINNPSEYFEMLNDHKIILSKRLYSAMELYELYIAKKTNT